MITAFFLGGTISMAGEGTAGGAVARLAGTDLLASVPGLAGSGVEVDVRDFRRMPSASFTFADVLELVEQADASDADGVVVVQGTDTIEETAFLIDLVWQRPEPVVVTGAMRTPAMAGADGPANLLAAITVARSAAARGRGVLVVLDDEIHAARSVAKRHTSGTGAFGSPNTGPVGRLVEGEAIFFGPAHALPALARPAHLTARVPVLVTTLGDDGALLDADARWDGVVVAAFGVGHVPERWVERLGALAARKPVVLASRIGAGPVHTHTYGAVGSETDLRRRGLLTSGYLNAYQARLLLLVLLSNGTADVRAAFTRRVAEFGGPVD
ncbi:MAG TPA: asparaginase [Jatrophihabitans sp.]